MSRVAKVGEYVRCLIKDHSTWNTPPKGMKWPEFGEVFQVRRVHNFDFYHLDRKYPNDGSHGDGEWKFRYSHFEIVQRQINFTDILNPSFEWVKVDD